MRSCCLFKSRRLSLLLAPTLLLLLVAFGSTVTAASAAINEVPSRSCTLDVDGTCVEKSAEKNERVLAENDAAEIDAIQLPEPQDVVGEFGKYNVGYGVPQQVGGQDSPATLRQLKEMIYYMDHVASSREDLREVLPGCENKHELCAYWSAQDECTANPKYMLLNCAPACMSCDQLRFETRCPLPENLESTNIWHKGDLTRMFERIVSEYPTATVMSRPHENPKEVDEVEGDEYSESRKPWVVTVDDFLTPHECDTLVELGAIEGYERSSDVGPRNIDGTYSSVKGEGRTSSNSWCVENCYANATVKVILNKLEKLTQIPDANSEYLQLLQYEPGQFYQSHHDYIAHHLQRAQGVRILTVFLYLNNVDSELCRNDGPQGDGKNKCAGGTRFTDLDLTCDPKKGRALIWPSVLDESPNTIDDSTHHEALPVGQGAVKYGANAWFHQRDFKEPFKQSCI